MRKVFSLLLLLSTLAAQQVQRPQVGLTGNIGPLGSFPLFNNGTINLTSCADYTMTFPDMSATIIRVTSSASLTGTCNIIAPTSITAGSFGYEFVFQNATTGTASILVKGATTNGVTIPNGQAVTVIFDGTNYVQVGSAGGPGVGACAPGEFVNALNLGAPPTCQNPPTTYISNLIAATKPNTIFNGIYQQAWAWHFGTTSVNLSGLKLEEQDVGAGTGNSVVTISSFAGSPTTALTVSGTLNLSRLPSVGCLGTNSIGNIVSGTCTGGGPIVSPLIVPSIDGVNNLTITVPNSGGGNPVLSSSTGTIDISSLFVSNLAGHGVSCLQTDNTGAVTVTGLPCGSAAGGSGTVTSVGLTAPSIFTVTGSPVTTAGTINVALTPQPSTFVLAGPPLGVNPVHPAIVQSNVCITGVQPLTCTFSTPTQAGNLIIVAPARWNPAGSAPPFAGTVTDNLGQTYSPMPSYPVNPISYVQNSAAGVTSISTTGSNGVMVAIFEVNNIALTNAYDADSYNVVQIPGPPIAWEPVVTSNPNDFILAYWPCGGANSTTTPTAVAPWTLGGYNTAAAGSFGWVYQNVVNTGVYFPQVGTANCPTGTTSPNAFAVAFKGNLLSTTGTPGFRQLQANELPRTPWSSIASPVSNYLSQIDLNTSATFFNMNIGGQYAPGQANWGLGWVLADTSTLNPSCTVFPPEVEPTCPYMQDNYSVTSGVTPLQVDACGGSNNNTSTCGGFHVSGATGNIVMQANSGIMLPNTGQIISAGGITSDTSVSAPAFFTCTTANPCQTPVATSLAASKAGDVANRGRFAFPMAAPSNAPTGRISGGEPLATFHLHDFSATKPTNGQVPTFNSTLGVYVPATPAPGGGGGPPTGTASGDLSGSYPGPQVSGLRGVVLPTTGTGNLNWDGNVWNFSTSTGGGPTFPFLRSLSSNVASNVTAAEMAQCGTIAVTGTAQPTINLPITGVTNGQCINVVNYGTGTPAFGLGGKTINGQSSFFLPAATGQYPSWMRATYDGNNWIGIRSFNTAAGLAAGTFPAGNFVAGNAAVFTTSGSGVINANQLLGSAIPALPAAPGGNLNYNGTAWNFAGPTAWNAIQNPTATQHLDMGSMTTNWYWDFRNAVGVAFNLGESANAGARSPGQWVMEMDTISDEVSPLLIKTHISDVNKYAEILFTANGELQISKLKNAASLATDANGKIIPGTGSPGGGGPVKWSDLQNPDKALDIISPYPSYFTIDMSNAGTGFALYEAGTSQYPGDEYGRLLSIESYTDWVDPISVWGPRGGFTLNAYDSTLQLYGDTKLVGPIILETEYGFPVTNAPSLGTDVNGNIVPGTGGNAPIYSRVFANLPMDTGTAGTYWGGPTGPECNVASKFCTMTTPSVDGTYRFVWQLIQVAAGSGGTCNAGQMLLVLSWTDPDQDTNQAPYISGRNMQGQAAIVSAFAFTNPSSTGVTNFKGLPIEFRAKHGAAIQFRFFQSPPSNCDIPPRLTFRPALYGPLGY